MPPTAAQLDIDCCMAIKTYSLEKGSEFLPAEL
jgi:hypothetical protein